MSALGDSSVSGSSSIGKASAKDRRSFIHRPNGSGHNLEGLGPREANQWPGRTALRAVGVVSRSTVLASFTVAGLAGIDVGAINLTNYWDGMIRDPTVVEMANGGETLTFYGWGFAPREHGWFPAAGTVQRIVYSNEGEAWEVTGISVPVSQFLPDTGNQAGAEAVKQAFVAALAGPDAITGGVGADSLRGYDGDDTIEGAAGPDYLRGQDGADLIRGGLHFDDINGNQGNDTAYGAAGDDWVVGGKDDDVLFGDEGGDIVYGNLGSDTCNGGEGSDTLRGGQQDDLLNAGAGDDWLSGDRGDDTLFGGAGADIFHTFGDADLDRVIDFNAAEGDRVQLDPGTAYTVAQVGADAVISMAGGGRMVLANVQASSLGAGWIDDWPKGQVLTASGPQSVLAGGGGADTIVASQGGDTLSGGAGDDLFVFPIGWGYRITDFTPGADKLDIRAFAQDWYYAGSGNGLEGAITVGSDGSDGTIIWTGANIGGHLIYLDHVAPSRLSMNNWIIS